MRKILAFVEYHVRSFLRDKSDVFWVIAWPILLLVLTYYVFIPPSAGRPITIDVGVVNFDNSTSPFNGTTLIRILEKVEFNGTKMFNVINYKDVNALIEDLRKGKVDVGLVIPKYFGANATYGTAKITVYISGTSPFSVQIHKSMIQSFLFTLSKEISARKVEEASKYPPWARKYMEGIANPLNVTIKEEKPIVLRYRNTLLGLFVLSSIGMSFLYTGFILGATAVVREKERGTLDRILASPISEKEFLVGKLLGGLAILMLSAASVMIVGLAMGAKMVFDPLNPSHWLGILSLILVGISTISIGFMLSLVSSSTKSATNLGVALGLFLSFTAGIWIPKEFLPSFLKVIAEAFPPTWGIDVSRKAIALNRGFGEVYPDFLKTLIASTALLAIGVIAYKKTLRKYAEI